MKIFNLLTACAIAAPLLFVSCSDDAVTTPDADTGGVSVTLSLGISAGPADAISRADGDNYDIGLVGERDVNDAMIVIYDRPINSAEGGKVVNIFYLPSPLKFTYTTDKTSASYFDPVPSFYPQTDVLNQIIVGSTHLSDTCEKEFKVDDDELELGKRYYAIALCNFGPDMYETFKAAFVNKPLTEFRDYIYTGALYDTAAKINEYTNFRMTGINECSFIWERRTDGLLNLGDYLVQRLAARVDVAVGETGTEFVNYMSYQDDGYLRLAVYTQKENSTEYEIVQENNGPKWNFYLTDMHIVNAVDSKVEGDQRYGTYLIERSSPHSPTYKDESNRYATPVYLDNEGWQGNFSAGVRSASKYIFSPAKKYKDIYSLARAAGYVSAGNEANLTGLIADGTFHFMENVSNAKKNSSVVGYLTENTCSETQYTMLRIEGYTNASTSNIFACSRAVPNQNNLTKVIGDIPIMHNTDADSHIMDYAVVRNTIYRLRIKVIANDNKIYFRYYYMEPGETTQKEYTATAFTRDVSDNNQDNPIIND